MLEAYFLPVGSDPPPDRFVCAAARPATAALARVTAASLASNSTCGAGEAPL